VFATAAWRDGAILADYALLLMLGLEIKHYFADYALQFEWMIEGKGSFSRLGGYVHAAIHAVGTAVVFWLTGVAGVLAVVLVCAEFVVHYLLDYAKAHYGEDVTANERPRAYWALYGLDQLFHHLTYIALAFLVVRFS